MREWTLTVRALKVLVVVMGVMLVAGFAVLIVTIMNRMGRGAAVQPAPVAAKIKPDAAATASIALPPGATVVDMTAAGQNIVLRIKRPDGSEALFIVDADSGTLARTIELRSVP